MKTLATPLHELNTNNFPPPVTANNVSKFTQTKKFTGNYIIAIKVQNNILHFNTSILQYENNLRAYETISEDWYYAPTNRHLSFSCVVDRSFNPVMLQTFGCLVDIDLQCKSGCGGLLHRDRYYNSTLVDAKFEGDDEISITFKFIIT